MIFITGFALFRVLQWLLLLLLPFQSPGPLFSHFPWNKLRLWRQNILFHANFRLKTFLVLEWCRFSIVQFILLSIHLDGWLPSCLRNSREHWSFSAVELGKNLLGQNLVWRLRFLLVWWWEIILGEWGFLRDWLFGFEMLWLVLFRLSF